MKKATPTTKKKPAQSEASNAKGIKLTARMVEGITRVRNHLLTEAGVVGSESPAVKQYRLSLSKPGWEARCVEVLIDMFTDTIG